MQEVFLTIQGEGPLAGTPAIFCRLEKCNLACKWCDSEFDSGYSISLKKLLTEVNQARGESGAQLVVITGGEPLLQNIKPFCSNLNSLGYRVQIETAGTVWVPGLDDFRPQLLTIVVSPKVRKVHTMIEKCAADWKYIVTAGEVDADGLPIGSTQREPEFAGLKRQRMPSLIARPPKYITREHIFLQPCDAGPGAEEQTKANTEFAVQTAIKHGYRLSLQQHKSLGLR